MSHSHLIGALCSCHSHICDFAGSAQCPPEMQTSSHWPVVMLCIWYGCLGKVQRELGFLSYIASIFKCFVLKCGWFITQISILQEKVKEL